MKILGSASRCMQWSWLEVRVAILAGAFVIGAVSAGAAPSVYPVTDGYVNIDMQLNGTSIGSALGVPLTGVSVTADTAALTLDAIELTIAPDVEIVLSQPFGYYDQVTVESATLVSLPAFSAPSGSGTSSLYTVNGGPLRVTGSWAGTDSTGTYLPVTNQLISYDVLAITAVVSSNPFLAINSVTINSLEGTSFGEPSQNLTILASYFVATPEPGTGTLMAFALVVIGWRQRRKARSL